MAKESKGRFDINYVVDKASDANWKGFVGHIDEEMIRKTMPPSAKDTLVMVCGPDALMNSVVGSPWGVLQEMSKGRPQQPAGININNLADVGGLMGRLGYEKENTYRF